MLLPLLLELAWDKHKAFVLALAVFVITTSLKRDLKLDRFMRTMELE